MHGGTAYGNWGIAITIVLVLTFFVVRYLPMRTRMAKRSGGALIAFFVALFAEMYGFPLTIYLLGHFPDVQIPLDHVSGHLLGDLITWLGLGNGWLIVMLVSNVLIDRRNLDYFGRMGTRASLLAARVKTAVFPGTTKRAAIPRAVGSDSIRVMV